LEQKHLSIEDFRKATGITERPVYRLFGTWETFLQAAGLQIHPNYNRKIPDEELFREYWRVAEELAHPPSYSELANHSRHSIGVYENRFRGYRRFRAKAQSFGVQHGFLGASEIVPETELPDNTKFKTGPVYQRLDDRRVLGARIDFRALQYEPGNEQEVVFLFGMLAQELGFSVESVQEGFPDCVANRQLKGGRWQRVLIEFELLSSNFQMHGHDITKCDLIVCWKHDWKQCPIEVLSLAKYVLDAKK